MIKKLFVTKTNNVKIQVFRSLIVGVIASLIDVTSFMMFTEILGFYYLLANLFSFTLGLLTSYLLNIVWVFTTNQITHQSKTFIKFVLVSLVGLALNQAILWICIEYMMIALLAAKIIATLITFIWNFLARKYYVF